jgi:hypothetical protein
MNCQNKALHGGAAAEPEGLRRRVTSAATATWGRLRLARRCWGFLKHGVMEEQGNPFLSLGVLGWRSAKQFDAPCGAGD